MRVEFDKEKTLSVLLMVLGLLVLLALNLSCTPPTIRGIALDGEIGADADLAEQQARAVTIRVVCMTAAYTASGTLIGDSTVLTAAHVLPCMGTITVRLSTGAQVRAVPKAVDFDNDMLVLKTLWGVTAPTVKIGAEPTPGDVICTAVAHPIITRKCGTVVRIGIPGPGQIINGLDVIQGNSGGGVYNKQGELIGVVSLGCIKRHCGLSGVSSLAAARGKLGL